MNCSSVWEEYGEDEYSNINVTCIDGNIIDEDSVKTTDGYSNTGTDDGDGIAGAGLGGNDNDDDDNGDDDDDDEDSGNVLPPGIH